MPLAAADFCHTPTPPGNISDKLWDARETVAMGKGNAACVTGLGLFVENEIFAAVRQKWRCSKCGAIDRGHAVGWGRLERYIFGLR